MQAASGRPLTAYVDTVSTEPLLAPLPAPGQVATASTNDRLGVTEWRLSNGARVGPKPTTFKEDEILFRAVSPGGTSLASDCDFIPAETADEVIVEGGLGKLRSSRSRQDARWPERVGESRHRRYRGRTRGRLVA